MDVNVNQSCAMYSLSDKARRSCAEGQIWPRCSFIQAQWSQGKLQPWWNRWALGNEAWEKEGRLLLSLSACSDLQLIWKWACQLERQINAVFIHYSLGPRASDLGSTFSVWLSANAYEHQIKGSRGRRQDRFQLTNPSEGLKKGSY